MFSIKNGLKKGDALLPLLVNAAVDDAIWWVEVYPDGLKLNGISFRFMMMMIIYWLAVYIP
jgi:hypothetical protein